MMMHEMKKSQSSAQEEYREQQAVNNILFGGEWIYTTFSLDATVEFIQLMVSHDMVGGTSRFHWTHSSSARQH